MTDTTFIKFCLKCGADVSTEMNKLYRVELDSLNLAVVFFAFNVFQKWRHRVDSMPFNALFIKGLLCRIVIGSVQSKSTLHAVVARDQETTTTQSTVTAINLNLVKSSIKLLHIMQLLTHFAYG
jgi:hypothetical protein